MKLHGLEHEVKCDNFDNKLLIDANILGVDYLLKHNLNLNVDYKNAQVLISQS